MAAPVTEMGREPATPIERILVRLPNWLGDIMMALPALRALRHAFPDARLVGMTRSRYVELATRITCLDDVREVPGPWTAGQGLAIWRAVRAMRRERYDIGVTLAPSFEAALMMWLAAIPHRVGHATDHRRALLTDAVELRDGHRSDGLVDVVARLGSSRAEARPGGLECAEADRERAGRLFERLGLSRAGKPFFVNPAAAKAPRAWGGDAFRRLTDRLADDHPDAPILVHGEPPFEAPVGWPDRERIHVVSGIRLVELAAVLERCALYVGNDSGPMHLAAALGIPTVGIYGPSSPARTAPRGSDHVSVTAGFACSPCRERFFGECPSPPSADGRPPCLNAVGVEAVADAVGRLLGEDIGAPADR